MRHVVRPVTMTWLLASGGILLLAIPVLSLLLRAIDYRASLDNPRTRSIMFDAIALSATTSTISILIIIAFGTPIAWIVARHHTRMARLIDSVIDLPILLPPAVAGIALLTAFGRMGTVGGWLAEQGVQIGFTATAVVLAQVFVAAPFYIRSAKAGFMRFDPEIEMAAASEGASDWQIFRHITFPLMRNSVVAGLIIAWGRALGEFGATIMFAGNMRGITQTMPLAIYERFGSGDLPAAVTISVVLLVISGFFLTIVRRVGEDA